MAQRVIQLLRSGQLYTTKEAAKTAITSLEGKLDGEVILARYTAGAETKTLISVRHSFTPTGGGSAVSGWTFFDDPESLIQNLDKSASAVDGQVVTTVTQVDGLVSETKANVKDLQLGGYSKDTSATGSIGSTDTVNTALSKLENAITSVGVTSTDKTINVSNDGRDIGVNIDGTTLVADSNDGTISADLEIVALTSTEIAALTGGDNVREAYKLIYATDSGKTAIGDIVKIYKDSALVNFFLGHVDDSLTNADQQGESPDTAVTDGTGATALVYIMQLANGKYKLAAVDVSNFLEESEFSDGLQVSNHVVSVKVDSTSEEVITAYGTQNTTAPVLSVGANGVKVSNIQTAIDAKVGTLDYSDTAVTGEYVSQVTETDGVIAVTRTAVSGATLNSYSKGSDGSAVASTDTINQAISKLENQIDAAESGSKTEINTTVGGESATHMTIIKTQDASDNHDIYSFSLADVASEDALETEVTRAQTAEGELATKIGLTGAEGSRTWTPTTNYGGSSATVAANMEALATAIKANADAIAGLDYTDTAVAGQVVTEVDETNGVIAPTRANLSGITLAGFTADTGATGAIAATDTVAGALNKLQNKADASLNSVSGSNAIAVGNKDSNKDQQISLILDDSTTQSDANNRYAATSGNVLQITSDGLYLSEVWDCGVYA